MSYSSALVRRTADETLADAQRRKIDGILDMARVGPDMHVLEIGTGWGGLATRAAQRGARVTTLTISAEQARLAEERLAAAGRRRPRRRCCCATTARHGAPTTPSSASR